LKINLRKTLLLLTLALFAAACTSQQAGSGTGASAGASGCEIDAKKVCDGIKDLREARITGYEDDPSQREQNGNPTESWTQPITTPDKTELSVTCEINIAHHRVIYAHALRGPTLTPGDVEYLRNQGLCVNSQ
jgi:hypothetical protein